MRTNMGFASIGGMVLGAILGLLVGAFLGGNFATDFQLFGIRGYEATGILGLGIGLVLGALLGARWARRAAD